MNWIMFTLIGIIIGGVMIGMFVGTNCAKTYNKRIDELETELSKNKQEAEAEIGSLLKRQKEGQFHE